MTMAFGTASTIATPVERRATSVSVKLLAWTVFAGVLVAIAIYAVLVSAPPTVDTISGMGLIGP
jgi:hypothetical protein